MNVAITTISPVKKTLKIEVPPADVQAVYGDLLRRYSRQVKIPGFRPGKAPLELIRKRIGDDLGGEAAERVVERFGSEAIRREGLRPVAGGVMLKLDDGQQAPAPVREGEGYQFTLDVELLPEFEPKDYTGLQIARPTVDVEVEEVQREMEALRQSFGKLVDVTDRAATTGDFVVAQMSAVELGGSVKLERQKHSVQLGAQGTLPEFERGLTGRRVGEDVAFEVTYPNDFPSDVVKGRTLTFSGEVEEIKVAQVPELTDELVQPLGVGSVAELREKVKERLLARKSAEADRTARARLLERLLDLHSFEVPQSMVDAEMRHRLEEIGRSLAAQGVDLDHVDVDWKQVLEGEKAAALRRVREQILLDAISRKESLTVDGAELDSALAHLGRENRLKPADVKKRLRDNGTLEDFRTQLLRGKCLDWLFSQTHIV